MRILLITLAVLLSSVASKANPVCIQDIPNPGDETCTTTYTTGTPTTTNSTTNNAYTGDQRVVPSSAAPSLSNMSQDVCSIEVVGGVQKFGLGVSMGTSKRDLNCESLKLAK